MIGLRFFPLNSADIRGAGTSGIPLRTSAWEATTCDAKNGFGFCVFLRRQSQSEEAALSSFSRLYILPNLLGNERPWFVMFDPFCAFLCFKVLCFVFEKHRKFYLSAESF